MRKRNQQSQQSEFKTKSVNISSTNTNSIYALRKLFETELKKIYWSEKALVKTISKMLKNVATKELFVALSSHLEETLKQNLRVVKVFILTGIKAVQTKCEAMHGLIKELENIIVETEAGFLRDTRLLSVVQKVKHYEIASYSTLRAFAKTLAEDEAAFLLEESLNEEKAASTILLQIAQAIHNENFYGGMENVIVTNVNSRRK